jgi:hypothetical protein
MNVFFRFYLNLKNLVLRARPEVGGFAEKGFLEPAGTEPGPTKTPCLANDVSGGVKMLLLWRFKNTAPGKMIAGCMQERRAGLCAGLVWNGNHPQSEIAVSVLQYFLKKSPSRG